MADPENAERLDEKLYIEAVRSETAGLEQEAAMYEQQLAEVRAWIEENKRLIETIELRQARRVRQKAGAIDRSDREQGRGTPATSGPEPGRAAAGVPQSRKPGIDPHAIPIPRNGYGAISRAMLVLAFRAGERGISMSGMAEGLENAKVETKAGSYMEAVRNQLKPLLRAERLVRGPMHMYKITQKGIAGLMGEPG